VTALEAIVQRLEATVQHLTEWLPHNSRTSSRPPSSDPPQATAKRPRRDRSGRRPGGQPGHEGHTRALVSVAAVDAVRAVTPERCRRCQHPLSGEEPHPQWHQVTDLLSVKPVVTAYPLHPLACPLCGDVTPAELPADVPRGGFQPRVQAMAVRCTGAYHLAKRTTQRGREDLFGVSICVGTLANLEQATVAALAQPAAEARAYVPVQPVAYLDETGWREGRARAWLWAAVTTWVMVFVVRLSRRGRVAQELLGEQFWSYLITDCWSAYTWYPTWRRQGCWAHLWRDIEVMIERAGGSHAMGEALQAQARQLFH
jgi:transposase